MTKIKVTNANELYKSHKWSCCCGGHAKDQPATPSRNEQDNDDKHEYAHDYRRRLWLLRWRQREQVVGSSAKEKIGAKASLTPARLPASRPNSLICALEA